MFLFHLFSIQPSPALPLVVEKLGLFSSVPCYLVYITCLCKVLQGSAKNRPFTSISLIIISEIRLNESVDWTFRCLKQQLIINSPESLPCTFTFLFVSHKVIIIRCDNVLEIPHFFFTSRTYFRLTTLCACIKSINNRCNVKLHS